jgi:hypothetical protein
MQQMRKTAGGRQGSEKAFAITSDTETTPSPASEGAPTPAPAGDDRASVGLAATIDTSSGQMQEESAVVENAIQIIKQARPATSLQEGMTPALRASASVPESVTRFCTEQQIADAERWWQCISDLRAAGQIDEANAEQDRFDAAHPDFEPAEAR